jgi:hypothetical protein
MSSQPLQIAQVHEELMTSTQPAWRQLELSLACSAAADCLQRCTRLSPLLLLLLPLLQMLPAQPPLTRQAVHCMLSLLLLPVYTSFLMLAQMLCRSSMHNQQQSNSSRSIHRRPGNNVRVSTDAGMTYQCQLPAKGHVESSMMSLKCKQHFADAGLQV